MCAFNPAGLDTESLEGAHEASSIAEVIFILPEKRRDQSLSPLILCQISTITRCFDLIKLILFIHEWWRQVKGSRNWQGEFVLFDRSRASSV